MTDKCEIVENAEISVTPPTPASYSWIRYYCLLFRHLKNNLKTKRKGQTASGDTASWKHTPLCKSDSPWIITTLQSIFHLRYTRYEQCPLVLSPKHTSRKEKQRQHGVSHWRD